ncbi:hypothetical protein COLO4_30280 [Corchorus olitorius]|uniref:RNase H type-1 domain-containing protein n=1 Tax=Corchorus olitorius TaxID=93759 RepID=A0A1R3H9K5_9ROSI|nr:hypothetical protein COLO4_30280 [Corchorus olitorius]
MKPILLGNIWVLILSTESPKEWTVRMLSITLNPLNVNTDGSSTGNPGPSGAGGIIRDDQGHVISAFARKLGYTNSLAAELWGIRDGLQMAVSLGLHNKIIVEADSTAAIDLIMADNVSNHTYSTLIYDCRCLMETLGVRALKHVLREGNKCADILAKLGATQDQSFTTFNSTPDFLFLAVFADIMGVTYPRLMNSSSTVVLNDCNFNEPHVNEPQTIEPQTSSGLAHPFVDREIPISRPFEVELRAHLMM